jgi:hypothetical protein
MFTFAVKPDCFHVKPENHLLIEFGYGSEEMMTALNSVLAKVDARCTTESALLNWRIWSTTSSLGSIELSSSCGELYIRAPHHPDVIRKLAELLSASGSFQEKVVDSAQSTLPLGQEGPPRS